jgi:hypothetical protein
MAVEFTSFYLLWRPEVIDYFMKESSTVTLGDSVLGGAWLGIIAVGVLFQPAFPIIGKSMSAIFYSLGFRAEKSTKQK